MNLSINNYRNRFVSRRLRQGAAIIISVSLCFLSLPLWTEEALAYDDGEKIVNQNPGFENEEKKGPEGLDNASAETLSFDEVEDMSEDTQPLNEGESIFLQPSNTAVDKEAKVTGPLNDNTKVSGSNNIVALDDETPDCEGNTNTTHWKLFKDSGTLYLECTDGSPCEFNWMMAQFFTPGFATSKAEIKNVVISGKPNSISGGILSGFSEITSLDIPETVLSIGGSAFSGCSKLQKVNIPSGITAIQSNVFVGCSSLKEIDLPEGVTTIDTGAFDGCTALISTGIEKCTQLNLLGGLAFRNCSSMTSIDLSNTALTSLPDSAFQSCGVTDLKLPKGLTTLGDHALNGADYLTNVIIPSGVTSFGPAACQLVGWKAFEEDGTHTTIVLPYSIQSIAADTFNGNEAQRTDLIVCGAPFVEPINDAVEGVKSKVHSVTYQMHHDASTDSYEVTSQDSTISFTCDTCGDEVTYTLNDYAPISIDGQEAQAFKTAVGASGSLLTGYKVSLKDADNNAVTMLDNKLKITLPVSDAKVGENLQIYRMNDDGTAALLGAAPVTEAGLATFETDTAGGTFAVVRTTELTLTFDTVGGTPVVAESVAYSVTPSKPATDPTRDGYTFTGWFSDAACTTAFDFTQPLTANTTVYAGWKANEDTGDNTGDNGDGTTDNNTGNVSDGTSNSTTGNTSGVASKTAATVSPAASASTIAKTGDDLMPLGVLLASTSLMAALAAGVALRRKQNLS